MEGDVKSLRQLQRFWFRLHCHQPFCRPPQKEIVLAKAFSILSWNVEHFKGKPERLPKIVNVLTTEKPDVIALYEVEGKTVFSSLSTALPGYHWHITEGQQTQEILVGVKTNKTAFFSQRTEFKSGNNFLRPGALFTLTVNGEDYSLLFLHLKSHSEPIGLGLRDDQLDHAFKLKRTLDKALPEGQDAHFIILGDLNTMGMKYPFDKGIDPDIELRKIDRDAGSRWNRMRRLTKSTPWTWWNGPDSLYPKADLDHVIASKHLAFKSFTDKHGSTDKNDVVVRGWVDATTVNATKTWIEQHSDHSYLFFEVQRV